MAFAMALGAAAPVRADQQFVELPDLRIAYFDPGGTPLVPHVAQSFLAGLIAQRRLFDYVPDGEVNVYLKDFADQANAAMEPLPVPALLSTTRKAGADMVLACRCW